MKKQIYPCLWFNEQAKAAATFYCTVFDNAQITDENAMVVKWKINGREVMALNGGATYQFNEAPSFVIECDTQQEIDHYWNKLTADGGAEGLCGWCKDEFGISWQVVPAILGSLMADSQKGQKVFAEFMQMKKIDINRLVDA